MEQPWDLKAVNHPGGKDLVGSQVVYTPVIEMNATVIRLKQAKDNIEQCCLAAAVWPYQADNSLRSDINVDTADGAKATKVLNNTSYLQTVFSTAQLSPVLST